MPFIMTFLVLILLVVDIVSIVLVPQAILGRYLIHQGIPEDLNVGTILLPVRVTTSNLVLLSIGTVQKEGWTLKRSIWFQKIISGI